ncbi:MAG: hypothetical protein P8X48_10195 [Acidiferrobacteraceae bacterium]|jgi:hypothetical protein
MADELSAAREILTRTRHDLLARANVVATGVGFKVTAGQATTALSIVCSVTSKVPVAELATRDLVPASLDSIPTDVIQTGPIRAFQSRTDRVRPAPGGVSIGHRDITAGTLGCLVRKNGQALILSNNHVLANSNAAQTGDPILQPGPYDGGKYPDDHIANLEAFVPINFGGQPSGCSTANGVATLLNAIARVLGSNTRMQAIDARAVDNLVDAAIARPIDPQDVSDTILDVGTISGTVEAALGMALKKSGRTTGLTTGAIQQLDVTADVQYGPGQTARFTDQLMAGPMSQGGDSGSAVLDNDNHLVGLLFAGSDNSTIINRIDNVFAALGIAL